MTKECEGHEDDSLTPYPETSADDARFQSDSDIGGQHHLLTTTLGALCVPDRIPGAVSC